MSRSSSSTLVGRVRVRVRVRVLVTTIIAIGDFQGPITETSFGIRLPTYPSQTFTSTVTVTVTIIRSIRIIRIIVQL